MVEEQADVLDVMIEFRGHIAGKVQHLIVVVVVVATVLV
jgi:hypothetical protein